MKKLIDCVDMRYEDGTFLMVPRQVNEMDLVMLGFNGTEKWIRLQCRQIHCRGFANGAWNFTATICKQNGEAWSWHWGFDGYTLVSDGVSKMEQEIIKACKEYSERNGIPVPRNWR